MAWCDEVAYFILLSCLAHNLGSLVSPSAFPECSLAGHRGLTWTALRGASHHWSGVSKTTLPVDIHGQKTWISAPWLGLDGSGSRHWSCRPRSDGHRPITSLCSLNQTTATFCALSWAEASAKWLGVVSQCARFGTAAEPPNLGDTRNARGLRPFTRPYGWHARS